MARHLGLPQQGCLAATVVVCLALFIDAVPRPVFHCHEQLLLGSLAAASNRLRGDVSSTSNTQQPTATTTTYSHSTLITISGCGYHNGTSASVGGLNGGAACLGGGDIFGYLNPVGFSSNSGAVHRIDSGEKITQHFHYTLQQASNGDQVNKGTGGRKPERSTSQGVKMAGRDHAAGQRRREQSKYTPPPVDRIAHVMERYTSSTASSPVNPFEGLGKLAFICAVVCAFILLPASGTAGVMRGAAAGIGQGSSQTEAQETVNDQPSPGSDCRFSSGHLKTRYPT